MTNGLKYRRESILSELTFETSRSSGKGGQHVNKTESRVTLVFNLDQSLCFSEQEKARVRLNLKNRLSHGVLRMSSQDSRSQHRNKEIVINRFFELLSRALQKPKPRKKTGPSKAQKEARFKAKKQHSEKKQMRKKPRKEDY